MVIDSEYYLMRANMTGAINLGVQVNTSPNREDNKEKDFWDKVSQEHKKAVFDYYKFDLLLFNYTLQEYFDHIGSVIY